MSRADSQRYLKLLEFTEVRRRIESTFEAFEPSVEEIAVDRALRRIAAEDVISELEIPGQTVSAMDGYALRLSDLDGASPEVPRTFRIKGDLYPNSDANPVRVEGGEAVHVSTGAPIPEGCDAVVRMEETRLLEGRVQVARTVERWKNISLKGEDIHKGQLVLKKRKIIGPADIALLIAVGRKRVKVFKDPVVGILSVGNELRAFDPEEVESLGHTTTNNYANLLGGFLQELGLEVRLAGIAKDDPSDIAAHLRKALKDADAIITVGGSSVGQRDYTPDAVLLAGSEARTIFHGVKVVPIRPTGMAVVGGKPVIVVPGHSVSATLAFFEIVLPAINLLSGLSFGARQPSIRARAKGSFSNDRPLKALMLARLERASNSRGEFMAVPLGWGSNMTSNLSLAHGFVRLASHETITDGEEVEVRLLGTDVLSDVV